MLPKALRRGRLSSSMEPPQTPTRMSILPINHLSLPSLRWWDGDKAPTNNKSPLLSLRLSSHTFLDSSIKDDQSAAVVYTIKTRHAFTRVVRCDDKDDCIKIAMIKWPGSVSKEGRDDYDRLAIKMKGQRWDDGQSFLKSGSQSDSSRKFTIPDYAHAMKWKRYGTTYWCTTSGVKGAVAILDLAKGLEPMRLVVYETFHDKYDPQALSTYKGVSLLLLDYLIVTALLSATDVTAWMHLKKVDMSSRHSMDSDDESYFPVFPHHPYGMASQELRGAASEVSLTSTSTGIPPSAGFHRSLESYATRMPGFLASDASSSVRCSFGSMAVEDWSKDYWAFLHGIKPTSSAESLQYISITSGRNSQQLPPVPPLPPQFSKSPNGPRASTSSSQPYLPDDPRTPTNRSIFSTHLSPHVFEEGRSSPSSERQVTISSSRSTYSIARSETQRRPLPKTPTESGIRRIRSSTQLAVRSPAETHPRHLRSLPVTPIIETSAEEPSSSIGNRASVIEGSSHLPAHPRTPPMTKASQEDFTKWVNELTNTERVLPPAPLSESVVYDMPPPSYASIYRAQRAKRHLIPNGPSA